MTTTTAPPGISREDRRELRAVIKMHMRTLRAEVAQREADTTAEIETLMVERYRDDDGTEREFTAKVRAITADANTKLHALMEEYSEQFDGGTWSRVYDYNSPHVYRKQREDRGNVRKAMAASIKARAVAARLDIDRREADMLREIALDAIEADTVRAFVRALPGIDDVMAVDDVRTRALSVGAP